MDATGKAPVVDNGVESGGEDAKKPAPASVVNSGPDVLKDNVRRLSAAAAEHDDADTLAAITPTRFKAAETTQIMVTKTVQVIQKSFGRGTQFLSATYLGEQAVGSAVWPHDAANAAPKGAMGSEEGSKSNEAIPTAQHLPPGANVQLAETKKAKAGAGSKGSKGDDDDDDGDKDGKSDGKSDDRRDGGSYGDRRWGDK